MWFFFEMLSVSCACTKISRKTKNPKNFPFKMDFFLFHFRSFVFYDVFAVAPGKRVQWKWSEENGRRRKDFVCRALFSTKCLCSIFDYYVSYALVLGNAVRMYTDFRYALSHISLHRTIKSSARASLWIYFVLLLGPVLYTLSMYVRRKRRRSSSGRATTST